MTQTHDPIIRAARMEALNRRFVEIVPEYTIYGPEFEGLDFDCCACSRCDGPVGGYIMAGEDGCDHGTWAEAFMDADWNLWCEDCSWEAACEEVDEAECEHLSMVTYTMRDWYETGIPAGTVCEDCGWQPPALDPDDFPGL